MISDIKKLFYIIGHYKNNLFFIIFCFLILAIIDLIGIGIIIPYINLLLQEQEFYSLLKRYSIDAYFLNFKYLDLILLVSFFILFIFLIKLLLVLFINLILVKFEQKISLMIKEKLINSYLNIDYDKYVDFKTEKAQTNLVRVSTYVSVAVLIPCLRILSDLIIIIFISIFLLLVDFIIFMIIFIFLSLCILFYYVFFKNLLHISAKKMNQGTEVYLKGLNESSRGFKEFTVLNVMKIFKRKIDFGLSQIYRYSIINRMILIIPSVMSEFIIIVFLIMTILIKIYVFEVSLINEIATFGVFALAGIKLLPKFTQLASNVALINSGKFSIPIIYEDLIKIERKKNKKDFKLQNKFFNIKNNDFVSLEFNDVDFSYKNSKNKIIKKLNLKINSQNIYGIYGASGAGKTTFIDIFLKFLQPTRGQIFYNNKIDFVKDISMRDWHSKISYIPQKITYLNTSILENITMEQDIKKIDLDKFNYALRLSRSNIFIDKLDNGIYYQIGESGIKLSGGQLQRIALARSIYFDRKIIILDEATNALDVEIEKEILEDLKKIKGQFTIIIITHRESVLDYCNHLIYLKNGNLEIKNNEK